MGDGADLILDSADLFGEDWWDIDEPYGFPRSPGPVCKYCLTACFWKKVKGAWRLYEFSGKQHACRNMPNPDTEEAEKKLQLIAQKASRG